MTTRRLWIDGTEHIVPHAVWADRCFLKDLNDSLVKKCEALTEELNALRLAKTTMWTPLLKEAVIWRARLGVTERANVLVIFDLSPEELDSWIARYDEFGVEGLKTTRLQDLGRRRAG